MNRSQNFTIAAILQFVIGVATVVTSIPDLGFGANVVEEAPDSAHYFFNLVMFAFGVLALVSVYGLWQGQKWGALLAIVTRTLDGLLALPGLLFAPTFSLQLMAITGVTLAIVVNALLLWPKPRLANASEQA